MLYAYDHLTFLYSCGHIGRYKRYRPVRPFQPIPAHRFVCATRVLKPLIDSPSAKHQALHALPNLAALRDSRQFLVEFADDEVLPLVGIGATYR